jgi:adenine deaminase
MARVIQVVPDQLVTKAAEVVPTQEAGHVVSDPSRDLLKITVIDRHTGSGRVGKGLVSGMGLKEGAIAGTVAHDHHNLVAVGVDDTSILKASRAVADMAGGLAVASGRDLLEALPLPVAGLMSDHPIETVRSQLERILRAARSLGTHLHDPFMAMSFLALEVIPSLKITDQGLVDVDRFEKVGFWI